jgi:hypothetical protein
MRRLAFLAIVLATAMSCGRREGVEVQATEEGTAALASVIHVADPKTTSQLVKGFHVVEQNAWRWTMGNFVVVLRPPLGAAQKGATLNVRLSVPHPVIDRLKAVKLTATVGGSTLPAETYSTPGEHVFSREVPAAALASDAVTVEFTLDKFLASGTVDQRELGIVVSTIGLDPK